MSELVKSYESRKMRQTDVLGLTTERNCDRRQLLELEHLSYAVRRMH